MVTFLIREPFFDCTIAHFKLKYELLLVYVYRIPFTHVRKKYMYEHYPCRFSL